MIVDTEGSDVGCKAVTSVLAVPNLCAAPNDAHIEGTVKTILKDTYHVKETGCDTKSSGAVRNEVDGTEVHARLTSTFSLYLSVIANDLHNVAPAYGDVAEDVTPPGRGVGESFIVSVAAGDAPDTARNTSVGRRGRTGRIRHKNTFAKKTEDIYNCHPSCSKAEDCRGASVETIVTPVKH